jgi:hypothetical protein
MRRIILVLLMTIGLGAGVMTITASPASAWCYGTGTISDNCRTLLYNDNNGWSPGYITVKCDDPSSPGNADIVTMQDSYAPWFQAYQYTEDRGTTHDCPFVDNNGVVAVQTPVGRRLYCEMNNSNDWFLVGHSDGSWHNLGFPGDGRTPDFNNCQLVDA